MRSVPSPIFSLPPSLFLFPIFVGSNLLCYRNFDLYKLHVNNKISSGIYLPIHGHVFCRRNHLPSSPPNSTSGLPSLYRLNESGHWSFSCRTLFWFGVFLYFFSHDHDIYFLWSYYYDSFTCQDFDIQNKGVLSPILNLYVFFLSGTYMFMWLFFSIFNILYVFKSVDVHIRIFSKYCFYAR